MNDKDIAMKVAKPIRVMIRFKSMVDILLTDWVHFDVHGNLRHADGSHIAPSYFKLLGQMKVFERGHTFPRWVISEEWDDIFHPNMALRIIAAGGCDQQECVELAKNSVVIP